MFQVDCEEWGAAPFQSQDYELLDFGGGRRLERFGAWILDRPSPAAEGPVARPQLWRMAHSRFERARGNVGKWVDQHDVPQRWTIQWGPLIFELKRNESGHVGLFPEQAANWNWLYRRLRANPPARPILNLFAYTGGATLAAALAGAEVVHVDAARNVVGWARRNAEHSGLESRPIHWIVEDARKFVRRELRRGKSYEGIILDPPSYGHGPRGEAFQFHKDIEPLVRMCFELMDPERGFFLFTCHTPGYGTQQVTRLIHGIRPEIWQYGAVKIRMMVIPGANGRLLPSGMMVRWDALGTPTPSNRS
ncbi:MAG: class I SAM-dependent methyltransferase [Thermogutta sp.]|uniref:class I SAM-dependent methyltransferase n=1 Tax=Thermogutta sp. TaxID=1962930 RepID=UPI0019CD2C9B|nr:class I SAM-dependent methyltransferase [Thermogutta sp.]MBC7353329.1 class I SAM-dependent methyltransferase [Thermogutta sp.]